ncbi:DUF6456 domain-containing protein [Ciceribacter sp. RN22]|uniref:DUF6456 domain-containing protein n=1 Tax=Ciceribacter sp. RN22 TaxID=2954932 RepID=UPI0020934B4E|nr:DUF6456 domain-containing protein [Ciceribacter sp. RN22]MCO6177561.1 DUF6456 domain-containing protein [Ciceribacter sp. RN22]
MADGNLVPAERKALLRLMRLALSGPMRIAGEEGGACRLSGSGGEIALSERLLRLAVARGLLKRRGRAIVAGKEARAYLRRALADPEASGFADQHREIELCALPGEEGGEGEAGTPAATVRRNLAESPLGPLARLKGRDGKPFLDAQAIEAGERLAADFLHAGLQPRITSSWEPRLSSRVKGAAGGAAELGDGALAARRRVTAAVEAMGPELAGVALDVCCFMKGLETVERERQWPVRSAKLMLRAALMALARHYAPPAAAGRHTRHWGAEDYRPEIG